MNSYILTLLFNLINVTTKCYNNCDGPQDTGHICMWLMHGIKLEVD